MSYVDEVYEKVTAQNPNEPEFHQAVKEVLDSLKFSIARMVSWRDLLSQRELFRLECHGLMTMAMCR